MGDWRTFAALNTMPDFLPVSAAASGGLAPSEGVFAPSRPSLGDASARAAGAPARRLKLTGRSMTSRPVPSRLGVRRFDDIV